LEDRLKPILLRLRSVMGQREPFVRTHNVVFVPCGSDAQPWHYDDSVRLLSHRRYFTILISLNPIDENCGGTEIWDDYSNKTDLVSVFLQVSTSLCSQFSFLQIRPRPGDAFVFHGGLRHRGCGNSGKTHRLFYYASFSCGTDDNVAT
jgi:ectoine hydroxylase-related dioxygenase (phytanoyl-CoA dioxygenase family)